MTVTVPERGTKHPFNMYTHIGQQPDSFSNAVDRNREVASRFAEVASGKDRLYVVGIGTSWHATLMAEYFARAFGGGMTVIPVHSFDFVLYGPELTERDAVIVISHTGRKSYSVDALERGKNSPSPTALVTGEEGATRHEGLEHLFVTSSPEGSATYTFSYTSALAVLASVIADIGSRRTGTVTLPEEVLSSTIPDAMRGALDQEDVATSLAPKHANHRRIWLAGAGPAGVTAMEAALKIKESSYLQAEGFSTEQMLHGPFQSVEPDDLMILVAPAGSGQTRTLDLAKETKSIGLDLIVVSDGSSSEIDALADGSLVVPQVEEPFSAITTLIPLHHLAYWLAMERGTNPDRFRLDDERFAKAFALARL